jgi:hypothetical protein
VEVRWKKQKQKQGHENKVGTTRLVKEKDKRGRGRG